MTDVIRFHCVGCGKKIKVPGQFAGQTGNCPQCGASVVVPTLDAAPVSESNDDLDALANAASGAPAASAPLGARPPHGLSPLIPAPTLSPAPPSPVLPVLPVSETFNCPTCGSDQTQMLSVVYQSGTSSIQTKSTHRGVGFASGGQLVSVVGSGKTSGVQQTRLAATAAPPAKQAKAAGALGGGIILGLIVTCGYWPVGVPLLCLFVVVGIWILRDEMKYNREQWPPLYAAWTRTWLCHRCGGKFFGPDKAP